MLRTVEPLGHVDELGHSLIDLATLKIRPGQQEPGSLVLPIRSQKLNCGISPPVGKVLRSPSQQRQVISSLGQFVRSG
jgi:hypothetical protein